MKDIYNKIADVIFKKSGEHLYEECYEMAIDILKLQELKAIQVEAKVSKPTELEMINKLRENEGAAVTIVCDNPEFYNGYKNNSIFILDDWTNWENKRFEGDTLLECLTLALSEKEKAC